MSVTSSIVKWFHVLLAIAFFGLAFVIVGVLQALGSSMDLAHLRHVEPGASLTVEWMALLRVVVLFALLGSIFGTAVTLDARSDLSVRDHPRVRTGLSAVLGAAVVFVCWSWYPSNFHPAWSLSGAAMGAVLGWFGWRWAQHVDF